MRHPTKESRLVVMMVLAVLAVMAVLTVPGSSNAQGEVIVDDDWLGADYTRIQDAVDNATDGTVIRVNAGLYDEYVDIEKDNIEIHGNGTDTLLQMPRSGTDHGFWVNASNVTIHGFRIEYFYYGIELAGADNCTIYDCLIDSSHTAVYLSYSDGNHIYNVTTRDFLVASYHVDQLGSDGWVEIEELHFPDEYDTRWFDVESVNGAVTLRFVQRTIPFGNIEMVQLTADGQVVEFDHAKYLDTGEDVSAWISAVDNEVIDSHEREVEISWSVDGTATVALVANEHEEGFPMTFDGGTYVLDSSVDTVTVDGKLEDVGEPLYSPFWRPSTGHPDSTTYIYVCNDDDNVYFSLDVTSDNTYEPGKDWAEVIVDGVAYRVDDSDQTYGMRRFGRTDKVAWRHNTVEFAVPMADIPDGQIDFSIRYYGTLAVYDQIGILLENSHNNSIYNNTCSNMNQVGINVYFSYNNLIYNNDCTSSFNGIIVDYSGWNTIVQNDARYSNVIGVRLYDTLWNLVDDNMANGSQQGFYLQYANNDTISNNSAMSSNTNIRIDDSWNNIIENNTCNWAVSLDSGISLSDSSENILQHNTITYNDGNGISMNLADDNTLRWNDISYNSADGVYLSDSDHNDLLENLIMENGDDGVDNYLSIGSTLDANEIHFNSNDGIELSYSDGISIVWNNITNNFYGVWLELDAVNTSIQNNSISENEVGVYKYDAAGSMVHCNVISDNSAYGAYNQDDTLLDARWNYWGALDGPGGSGPGSGDSINVNITYMPWYTSATVSPSRSFVRVKYNPTRAIADNIQDGLDVASAGDTLQISAGTYYGTYYVNTTVDIIGAGDRWNQASLIDAKGRDECMVVNAGDASITGMAFYNTTGVPGGKALWINADGVTVRECNFTETGRIGVYGYYADNVTIKDSVLINNGLIGIAMWYCDDFMIKNNLVDDSNDGIDISHSAFGTVTENEVTDCSDGIEIDYDSNNITVSWNDITFNEFGIRLDTAVYNDIHNNTFDLNYDSDMYLDESDYNEISWNTMSADDFSIYLRTSRYNIIGNNSFTNSFIGVYTLGSSNYNEMYWDTFDTYRGFATQSPNVGNIVHYSSFLGTIGHWSSHAADMERNWWNSADGPGGSGPGSGAEVEDVTDYEPWYATSTTTPDREYVAVWEDTGDKAPVNVRFYSDSLQVAIDNAGEYDTITILGGSFEEDITIGDGVNIVSEEESVIDGDVIVSGNVRISGATITVNGDLEVPEGSSLSIEEAPDTVVTENVWVDGVLYINSSTWKFDCSYDGEFGITVNSTGELYIQDNGTGASVIMSNTTYAYYIIVNPEAMFRLENSTVRDCGWAHTDPGLVIYANNSVIWGATLFDNWYGATLDDNNGSVVYYTESYNNNEGIHVEYSEYIGLYRNDLHDNYEAVDMSYTDYAVVSGNEMVSSTGDGFRLRGSHYTQVYWNNISGSGFNGMWTPGSNYMKIENNSIDGNAMQGISASTSRYSYIVNNSISSNGLNGLQIDFHDVTVMYNEFLNNTENGVFLDGTFTGIVMKYNRFGGNSEYAVRNDGTNNLSAERNYWGHPTGPAGEGLGSGDNVSVMVIFTPWYASPTTLPSTEFVQLIKNPVVAYSDTIQGGIDGSGIGDTVFVSSGLYHENVVLDKIITLTGESSSNTTINGSNAGDVVSITANLARITQFTIVGSGASPGSWAGIEIYYSTNVEIDNNIFVGNTQGVYADESGSSKIHNNTFFGSLDNNIYIDSESNAFLIENNTLENATKNGILVDGDSDMGVAQYNVLNNNSEYQLWITDYSSFCNVENNTFFKDSNSHHLVYIDASSMYTVVANNDMNGGRTGVYIGANTNWNEIHNNTITSYQGIFLNNCDRNEIHNNTIVNTSWEGILLSTGSDYNSITSNTIIGTDDAILMAGGTYNRFTWNNITGDCFRGILISSGSNYNMIENNSFDDATAQGIYIASSHYNLVANNTIYDMGTDGIYLDSSNNNELHLNVISYCDNGISLDTSHFNEIENHTIHGSINNGILFYYSDDNELWHSDIYENGFSGIEGGVFIDDYSDRNLISDNNAWGNYYFGIGMDLSAKNNEVRWNQVHNQSVYGIYFSYSSLSNVHNNTVTDNGGIGIGGGNTWDHIIKDNHASNNSYGVSFGQSDTIRIYNNTLTANRMHGVQITYGISDVDHVWIENNTITWNDQSGIFITNGRHVSSSYDYPPNNIWIANNTVEYNYEYGVYIRDGYDINITWNDISFNNWTGLYIHEYCDNVEASWNLIQYSNEYGMYVEDSSNIVAEFNWIFGNTDGTWSDSNLMAERNYWGTADGPSGEGAGSGEEISTSIDYEPFYMTWTTKWYSEYAAVTYNPIRAYSDDIQVAIDNAEVGDTIELSAMTFNDNIIVNKTVDIMGQGMHSTYMNAGGVDHGLLVTADDVTISGINVTGGSGSYYGIYIDAMDTVISNCSIHSNSNYGIRIEEDDNLVEDCEVYSNYYSIHISGSSGNVVRDSNFGHNYMGVYIWAAGTNNTVEDNSFHSDEIALYNAYGHSNTLANNTVYDSDLLGIGFFKSSWNTIVYNEIIMGPQKGMSFQNDHEGNEVHYNRITGNVIYGIDNDGNGVVNATRNYWGSADGPSGEGSGSGDEITVNVTYEPWYATPTTTPTSEYVNATYNPIRAHSDTIQGGIDSAEPGDTVYVSAGTFYENVNVTKRIDLIGAGMQNTVIDAMGTGSNINVSSDWVNVTGFSVVNSGDQVYFFYEYFYGDAGIFIFNSSNIEISYVNASDVFYGMQITGSQYCDIHDITVDNAQRLGILFSHSEHFEVYDSLVNNTGDLDAIQVANSNDSLVKNNTMTYCEDEGLDIRVSSNVTVVDNFIAWNGDDGIWVNDDSYMVTLENNTIIENQGDGIEVRQSNFTVLEDNYIYSNYDNGVYVRGSGWTYIEYNHIINNTLTGILIEEWETFGFPTVMLHCHDTSANFNMIEGNADGLDNTEDEFVNAKRNWWGSADGPAGDGSGTGDSVSGNVTYMPWFATSTTPGREFVTVWYNPDRAKSDEIQAAIDAAQPGDNITIENGTYYGDLYIDKSLDFYANGTVALIGNITFADPWVNFTGVDLSNATFRIAGNGSIQMAINYADPGDTIYIEDGVYTEQVDIYNHVHMQGSGAFNTTVLDGMGGRALEVFTDNVTVTGIRFINSSEAVYIDASGFQIFNNSFYDNDDDIYWSHVKNDTHGIYNIYPVLIDDNEFNATFDQSIYIDVSLSYSNSGPYDVYLGDVVITNNTFYLNGTSAYGVHVSQISISSLSGGNITAGEFKLIDNVFYGADYGFYGWSGFTDLADVNVTMGNHYYNNNTFRNQKSVVLGIDYTDASEWVGNTAGGFGDLYIIGNQVNTTWGIDGIEVNDYAFIESFHDNAVLSVGDLYVSHNDVLTTGGYGINIEYSTIMHDAHDSTSVSMGDAMIDNNTVRKSSRGIRSYYSSFENTTDNAMTTIGDTSIVDNDVQAFLETLNLDFNRLMYNSTNWSSFSIGSFEIYDNTFNSTAGSGIEFDFASIAMLSNGASSASFDEIWVHDNEIVTSGNGIVVDYDDHGIGGSMAGDTELTLPDLRFEYNNITAFLDGIQIYSYENPLGIEDQASVDFGGLDINNNTIDAGDGIFIHHQDFVFNVVETSQLTLGAHYIVDNVITAGAIGVKYELEGHAVEDNSSFNVEDLVIQSNEITGQNGIDINHRLYATDDSSLTIGLIIVEDNNVTDCSGDGIDVQVEYTTQIDALLDIGNCSIENNIIDQVDWISLDVRGFLFPFASRYPIMGSLIITENQIEDSETGVYFDHFNIDAAINYNWFGNNSKAALQNQRDEYINATLNYWNSSNGPDHPMNVFNADDQGEKLNGNASFYPWLATAYPLKGVTRPVVLNNDSGMDYGSIQDAIDDAKNGDTVYVTEGTFNEALVVDKELTIIGTGAYNTTYIDAMGGTGVNVTAPNATIEGFNIYNATYGVNVTAMGVWIGNCSIDASDTGVHIWLHHQYEYLSGNSTIDIGHTAVWNSTVHGDKFGVYIDAQYWGCNLTDDVILELGALAVANCDITGQTGIHIDRLMDIGNNLTGNASFTWHGFYIFDNNISSADDGIKARSGSGLIDLGTNLIDNSRYTQVAVEVIGNNVTAGSSGISLGIWYNWGIELYDNASFEFGDISIMDNEVNASAYGVRLDDLAHLGEYMYDNATFTFGDIMLDHNKIESAGYGIHTDDLDEWGRYMYNNTVVKIGNISSSNNTIDSGNYAIWHAEMAHHGEYMYNDAIFIMGNIRSDGNNIQSDSVGLYLDDYDEWGNKMYDSSSFTMGDVTFNDNVINSSSDAITHGEFQSHGYRMYNDSSFEMGDVEFCRNVIDSGSEGIRLVDFRYWGQYLYGTASVEMGNVRVDFNNITAESDGIDISLYQNHGYHMYNFSSFMMGDTSIDENVILESDKGLDISDFNRWGNYLNHDAYCSIGNTTFNDNWINGTDDGIENTLMDHHGHAVYNNSMFTRGGIEFNDNTIYSRGAGMFHDDFTWWGTAMSGTSTAIIGHTTFNDNWINSTGNGIQHDNIEYHGFGLNGDIYMERGSIEFRSNFVNTSWTGINLTDFQSWGRGVDGEALLVMGDLVISDNELTSINNGIEIDDLRFIGWDFKNGTSFFLGSVNIDNNTMDAGSFGMDIDWFNTWGQSFDHDCTFVMGDITINDNTITSIEDGIEHSDFQNWGRMLENNSYVEIGNLEIMRNWIDAGGEGMDLEDMDFWGTNMKDSTFVMGSVLINDNNITSTSLFDDGLDLNGFQYHGYNNLNSSFAMGNVELNKNVITSVNIGMDLDDFSNWGYNNDNSTFTMGHVQINNNTITADSGDGIEHLNLRNWGRTMENGSKYLMSDVEFSGNWIESDGVGLDLNNFDFWGYYMYDGSSFTMGSVRINDNIITTTGSADGIELDRMEDHAYHMTDSTFEMGDVQISWNQILSTRAGMDIDRFSSWGRNIDNSSVTIGNVEMSNNTITSDTEDGIDHQSLDYWGHTMYNGSSFSIGDIEIIGNWIDADRDGLDLDDFDYWGNYMYDGSSFTMGSVRINSNNITNGFPYDGIDLASSDHHFEHTANSTFTMGSFQIDSNEIQSSYLGLDLDQFKYWGSDIDNSSFLMGGLSVNMNDIISAAGGGIEHSELSYLGYMMRGASNFTIGDIEFNDNVIETTSQGFVIDDMDYWGHMIYNTSSVTFGSVKFNNNTIDSSNIGINHLGFEDHGSIMDGSSSFMISDSEFDGNVITSGSYGIYLRYFSEWGYEMSGSSSLTAGDLSASDNWIDSGDDGIYVPFSSDEKMGHFGSFISGSSNAVYGDFNFNNNTIFSDAGGINASFVEIGCNASDDSSVVFGDIVISDSTIESQTYGIGFDIKFLGVSVSGNASIDIGQVVISGNDIGCTHGINVSRASHIGNDLLNDSYVEWGGIAIEDNEIECDDIGILLSYLAYWGANMANESIFSMGDVTVYKNTINYTVIGIELIEGKTWGYWGFNRSMNSTASIGDVNITTNNIYNSTIGIVTSAIDTIDLWNNDITKTIYGIAMFSSSSSTAGSNSIKYAEIGLYTYSSVNITFDGNNIINCTDSARFIRTQWTTFENNDITTAGNDGIWVNDCKNITVDNNDLSDIGRYGILIEDSWHITVSGNVMDSGGIHIDNETGRQWPTLFISLSNIVGSDPVRLLISQSNITIPTDTGQLILYNCTGILVDGLNLSYSTLGLSMTSSEDITIVNTSFFQAGAEAVDVTGLAVTDSVFTGIDAVSFSLTDSTADFTRCTFQYAVIGISMTGSSDSNIVDCTFTGNSTVGILLNGSNGNEFINNTLENFDYGTWLIDSDDNLFQMNEFFNSSLYGAYLDADSTGNWFIHNDFANNSLHAWDLAGNVWNDTYPFGGNFWDDYDGEDYFSGVNQDLTGSDGIGDTRYLIGGGAGAKDFYPLMNASVDPVGNIIFVGFTEGEHVSGRMIIEASVTQIKPLKVEFFINGNSTFFDYEYPYQIIINTSDLTEDTPFEIIAVAHFPTASELTTTINLYVNNIVDPGSFINISTKDSKYQPDQTVTIIIATITPPAYDRLDLSVSIYDPDNVMYYLTSNGLPSGASSYAVPFELPSDAEDGTFNVTVWAYGYETNDLMWQSMNTTSFMVSGKNIHERFDDIELAVQGLWGDFNMTWNSWNTKFDTYWDYFNTTHDGLNMTLQTMTSDIEDSMAMFEANITLILRNIEGNVSLIDANLTALDALIDSYYLSLMTEHSGTQSLVSLYWADWNSTIDQMIADLDFMNLTIISIGSRLDDFRGDFSVFWNDFNLTELQQNEAVQDWFNDTWDMMEVVESNLTAEMDSIDTDIATVSGKVDALHTALQDGFLDMYENHTETRALVSDYWSEWNTTIAGIWSDIGFLNGTTMATFDLLSLVSQNLTAIGIDIDWLNSTLDQLGDDIAGMNTSITSILASMSLGLEDVNASLQSRLNDLDSALLSYVSTSEGNVISRVDDLETTLMIELASINTTLYEEIKATLDDLVFDIEGFNDSLVDRLNSIKTDILDNHTVLRDLIDTSITSLNASLQDVRDELAQDISDLESKLDAYYASLEAGLEAIADDLAMVEGNLTDELEMLEEDLEATISDLHNRSLAELGLALTNITNDIADLSSDLALHDSTVSDDLDGITDDLSSLLSQLLEFKTDTADNFDAINTSLAELEALSDAIATLEELDALLEEAESDLNDAIDNSEKAETGSIAVNTVLLVIILIVIIVIFLMETQRRKSNDDGKMDEPRQRPQMRERRTAPVPAPVRPGMGGGPDPPKKDDSRKNAPGPDKTDASEDKKKDGSDDKDGPEKPVEGKKGDKPKD